MKRPIIAIIKNNNLKEEEEEVDEEERSPEEDAFNANNKKLRIFNSNNNNNNFYSSGGHHHQNNIMLDGQQQQQQQSTSTSPLQQNQQETSPPPPPPTMEETENQLENNNASENGTNKKLKLNGDAPPLSAVTETPSKVVHIRNIPSDVSETEIVHLGIPFGRVSNVLVLKGKNQAFLELAEESAAIAMVSYFTNCVAQLRGRSVYVQFSTHKELKTDQSHSNANSAAQAALQAAQALVVATNSTTNNFAGSGGTTTANLHLHSGIQQGNNLIGGGTTEQNGTQGGPNTVLRVIIEQMLYPVTLDVLYQIFSRVGKVLRIVTFTKNNFFQALIQYPDVVMAQAAKLTLDGQNIYNGCCTLRIEYSKLSSLNVRYNNDKSRDYTNPNLPTGESSELFLNGGGGGGGGSNGVLGSFQQQQQQLAALLAASGGQGGFGNGLQSGGGGGQQGFAAALMQLQQQQQQNNHQHHNNPNHHNSYRQHQQQQNNNGNLLVNPLQFMQQQQQQQHFLPGGLQLGGVGVGQGQGGGIPGCVLLVSNLNEELITPDGLFTLFGVYGDVQRVKILFNKKDSALVQLREPAQAQLALTYLDRLKLQQKMIRVTLSKHGLVQMPKEGQPDAGLTKDYTNSPLHRFKKPDSKNYQNIYAPSATLHLSNIPGSVSEEELNEAFKLEGFDVKGFKFFPKDRKMALLQLSSIEEASEALIKLHNHQLRENSHLRVSFSKSTI